MPIQILRPPPGFLQLNPSHLPLMPSLHPCTAQKLSSCASAPELIPLPVPSPPIRRPPTLPTNPRHNNLLEESRWRNNNIRPPADWRPPPSSRFRNAHVSLDVKYDGTWRGNDERWVTGRDAETSPNPWPHRRRDMPPEALRHSAPNGPNRTSVVSADGLLPDQSPDPERSPPVKPCAHRNPCNCAVLRARLGVPETPAPVSPPSPSPTPPTEDGSASASTRSHQPIEPVKRTHLVAARLEVARARDNLAQERRRWLPASHAPPQTAALTSDLAESSPREPTTGPAVASDAPTVADPSSASRPSPAGFSLHRTTRMIPGEMHVRAAEASLANAMLRLVDLQSTARGHDLESTVRDTSDLVSTASTPVNDEEARPAASDSDLAPLLLAVSRPPKPHRTWVRPADWMPHKANWPGYSEPQPWPASWTTQRNGPTTDAPAVSAGHSATTPPPAVNSDPSWNSSVPPDDPTQPSGAVPSPSGSRDHGRDADLLRQYVNAEREQTAPIVLSPISPDDADAELVRLLSSVLGVPCSVSRREGAPSPGLPSNPSTQGSSTDPNYRSSPFSQLPSPTDARAARSSSQILIRHAPHPDTGVATNCPPSSAQPSGLDSSGDSPASSGVALPHEAPSPLPNTNMGESANELCITRARTSHDPGCRQTRPRDLSSHPLCAKLHKVLGVSPLRVVTCGLACQTTRCDSIRTACDCPPPPPPREQLEATGRSTALSTCSFTVLPASSPSSLLALSNASLLTTRTSLRSTTRAARAARRRQVAPASAPAHPTNNISTAHPTYPAPIQAPT